MFRKTEDHKRTAFVGTDRNTGKSFVTAMSDDGWEEILDWRSPVASEEAGKELLIGMGYEEFDPNAHLKDAGLVWDGACYSKP